VPARVFLLFTTVKPQLQKQRHQEEARSVLPQWLLNLRNRYNKPTTSSRNGRKLQQVSDLSTSTVNLESTTAKAAIIYIYPSFIPQAIWPEWKQFKIQYKPNLSKI
jgi:hypothetical protein